MEPAVRIVLESCHASGTPGCWQVAWRVHNDGPAPLQIDDAWVPHGRFRGEGGHVPVNLVVPSGESARAELLVLAAEAPGTVVENAFLILRANEWRIFARMRIEFGEDGTPRPVVVRVTTQAGQ